jgi:YbbR domain-containing protein
VEYKNLPDDLEVSSEPVSAVVLELRGPSGELHGATDVRPSVVLDMSNARPGERTYTIGDNAVKLQRGLRLVRSIPSEVRFNFEPRRTRTVPVELRFVGQGQNGYEVARADVIPIEVQIVGPRSRVARVNSAVTDQIDVSNVVGSSQFHVNLSVEDPYVRLEGPPEATVQVTMKKSR